jgi:membrane-bound lytic murein transglycosylase F
LIIKKLKYFLFSSLVCLILIGVESPLFASYEIQNFDNLDTDLSDLWVDDPVGQTIFLKRVSQRLPNYKPLFKQASKDLDVHWTLIAAISYQESHWDPQAISQTGVRGMMMLTQKTAKEMGIRKRTDPNQSILGGANYFQKTLERFPKTIPKADRIWMALAAYNLGFMNLNKARQLTDKNGRNAESWSDVSEFLPIHLDRRYENELMEGQNKGEEALEYVERIRLYYKTLSLIEKNKTKGFTTS